MTNCETGGVQSFIRNSPLLRLILIAFLVLILQIPISMIEGVIRERQMRRDQAIEDVTSKWGRQQTLIGPMITVPYIVEIPEKDDKGVVTIRTETHYAHFLPEQVHTVGTIDCQVRHRGIFEVPIYEMTLDITGRFAPPDFSDWGIDPDRILWDRACLTQEISDVHAITNQVTLGWNGEQIGFSPGAGEANAENTGIHAALKGRMSAQEYPFSYQLLLNGSMGAFFAPVGRDTRVEIRSDWDAPSFQGNWLPSERTVDRNGFQATWNIPFLGRNYPQRWNGNSDIRGAIASSVFGVNFISTVDHYRMAARSVKYEVLFLVLTFATLWLFEVLIGVRIHSIQYLLVGMGMCVFYLLELSLAEHIGFLVAYLCASAAIVILISAYCIAVLRGIRRGGVIATVTALLYAYLYVLLMNEDYALLIGSVGLFVVLGTVMYLTRKIDWYSFGKQRV